MNDNSIDTLALFPFKLNDGESIYALLLFTGDDVYDICPDCFYILLKGVNCLDQVVKFCKENDISINKEDLDIIDTLIRNSVTIQNVQIVPKIVLKTAVVESLNVRVAELKDVLQKVSSIWPGDHTCTTEESSRMM